MTVETQNPAPEAPKAETSNQSQSQAPAPQDDRAVAWERERASLIDQVKSAQGQLASVLKERDTFASSLKELEPKAKEADQLRLKVEDYVRRDREMAIISRVRAQIPHAGDLELRGVLGALHESGKLDRYSEDSENTAKKALEMIKSEAPNLLRAPMGPGGSAAAPSQPQGNRNSSRHPIWGG